MTPRGEGLKCKGCGYGWSPDCDTPDWYCGCGGIHGHDSLMNTACKDVSTDSTLPERKM